MHPRFWTGSWEFSAQSSSPLCRRCSTFRMTFRLAAACEPNLSDMIPFCSPHCLCKRRSSKSCAAFVSRRTCTISSRTGSDAHLMNLGCRLGLIRKRKQSNVFFSGFGTGPSGVLCRGVVIRADEFVILVRAATANRDCPLCGERSRCVHSRYERNLVDLPVAGRRRRSVLRARRFFCDATACSRKAFAERFQGIVEACARRTTRLDDVVHCLAIAFGGKPTAALSRRLKVEVSNDTLLRVVRRRGVQAFHSPSVIGFDDWAWRRNLRYGTLICDLERRKTIALLPDREPATAEAWSVIQSQICVVARDRWNLMENAGWAFLDAVRKRPHQNRATIEAATIDPALLTFAESFNTRVTCVAKKLKTAIG